MVFNNFYLKNLISGMLWFQESLDFRSQDVEKKNNEVVSKIRVEYFKNRFDDASHVLLAFSKTAIAPIQAMLIRIPYPQNV